METMVGLELKGTVLQGARAVPSLSTIYRVRRCMRVNGRAGCAKGRGGRGIPLGCSQIMALRKWCKEPNGKKRGTRLRMACAWFETVYEERPHRSTMCRWLRLLKLTRKKGTRVAAQQDPERVALFWERCNDVGLDPWETVWFDECGFDSRDFLMEYGYSPEGERFDTVEWLGRGRRINCLSSMTVHGLFAVDFYHNGSITYEVFEHHVLNTIAPRMLQRGLKNLIMDNASIHHACRNRIVRILAMMGILVIWLAPYYPQGNPIGARMCYYLEMTAAHCLARAIVSSAMFWGHTSLFARLYLLSRCSFVASTNQNTIM